MIQRKEFYISCDGIRLHCKLDRPVPETSRASHSVKIPMVLVIPGLTGHMEEPHIAAITEALPRNGYACLRVELYGHGKSGGDFHDHTLLHWALELMEVIDYARKLEYVSELISADTPREALQRCSEQALSRTRWMASFCWHPPC